MSAEATLRLLTPFIVLFRNGRCIFWVVGRWWTELYPPLGVFLYLAPLPLACSFFPADFLLLRFRVECFSFSFAPWSFTFFVFFSLLPSFLPSLPIPLRWWLFPIVFYSLPPSSFFSLGWSFFLFTLLLPSYFPSFNFYFPPLAFFFFLSIVYFPPSVFLSFLLMLISHISRVVASFFLIFQ